MDSEAWLLIEAAALAAAISSLTTLCVLRYFLDKSFLQLFKSFLWRGSGVEKSSLPKNATREQVEAHIAAVLKAIPSLSQSFSSDDLECKKLVEVGPDNIKELIGALSDTPNEPMREFALLFAIQQLASPLSKGAVLDSLRKHPALIQVVSAKGWEKDAKDIMLETLPNATPNSMGYYELIRSLGKLGDSSISPVLKRHFLEQPDVETYKVIRNLPGIEITDEELESAWDGIRGNLWNWHFLGFELASRGSKRALLALAAKFDIKDLFRDPPNSVLISLAGYEGPEEGFKAWLSENAARLEFDKEKGRFAAK